MFYIIKNTIRLLIQIYKNVKKELNFSLFLGAGLQKARSLVFINLIISQIVNVYDCKTNKRSKNKYMNVASTAKFNSDCFLNFNILFCNNKKQLINV